MKFWPLGLLAGLLPSCMTLQDTPPSLTDTIVTLQTQDMRNIDLRYISLPECEDCPLIIFSHGANAAYDRYNALLVPFAKAGYHIAAPNHTDSEEHAQRQDYKPEDWLPTRLEDYATIMAYYKPEKAIAVGHSFGGLIAQVAGGTELSDGSTIDAKYRPNTVIAYSPPGPISGFIGTEGWQKVSTPSLIITGTKDIVPNMTENWELHLASFDAAPKGTAYALIYDDMDHYMNGAYGRENNKTTPEKTQAINHMVEASLAFISATVDGGLLSPQKWSQFTTDFVEARTNE